MEATLRDGNAHDPAECKPPTDASEEQAEAEGTNKQGWATEAPAPENKMRSPTSSQPSAECAGGRGRETDGKKETPGADRTGGGQTDRQTTGQDRTGCCQTIMSLMQTMTNNSHRSGNRHGVVGSQAYTSPGLTEGQEATTPASLKCPVSSNARVSITTINTLRRAAYRRRAYHSGNTCKTPTLTI